MTKNTPTKRNFNFSADALLEETPILPTGVYAATLIGCSVVGKEDKQHIQVVPERVYNKEAKVWEETGDFLIQGNIYYGVELFGKEARAILGKDEPRFYGGKIAINIVKYDQENPNASWGLDSVKNTCLVKACKILNIDIDDLINSVENPPITSEGEPTIPLEELKRTFKFVDAEEAKPTLDLLPEAVLDHPDVEFMLNFVLFYRELFSLVTQLMNLQNVGVSIEKRVPDKWNKLAAPDNAICIGNSFNPTSAGFIAYKEGMN